jgi:NADP-dependent 3-hydroxy acid dehydrogenase YdfG
MPETVVITGASAGVGRATAHAFAVQGAQIGLMARGTQGLQAAAAEVESAVGRRLRCLSTSPIRMPSKRRLRASRTGSARSTSG